MNTSLRVSPIKSQQPNPFLSFNSSFNNSTVLRANISSPNVLSKKRKFETPSKSKLIFTTRSPNISKKKVQTNKENNNGNIFLSRPILASPTKLNVVTSDWKNDGFRSSLINSKEIPSSFKDNNNSTSPKKKSLKKASSLNIDRFIPSRTSSSRLFNESYIREPEPSDSPSRHIEYQSNMIYKSSVAQVCGVNVNEKILQFQPAPPTAKGFNNVKLYDTLNEKLNSVLETSRLQNSNSGLNPTIALQRSRRIPTVPQRILDAPGLVDDFYLNLLSWSCKNLLAVALENSVYIWQASAGTVDFLTTSDSLVTSLSWSNDGYYLSIGKQNGCIEVWDIEENTKLRTMRIAGNSRIATHSWSSHLISNGTINGEIFHNDVRLAKHIVGEISDYHTGEICGLSWRKDAIQYASGGNDNVVNIWDSRLMASPVFNKQVHKAAVKAISWCDYQSSLLASGGGSNDKCIHFWNTSTGARINSLNTGSQVTSINWGESRQTGREIVVTAGYPTNSVSVYNYNTLNKTGEILNSHEARILYSQLSPDGTILATAAADENLKFWKIFDVKKNNTMSSKEDSSLSSGGKQIRRVMTIR